MKKDLTGKTLGIIHASFITHQIVQNYIDEFIPDVTVAHAGDDTIQMANNAAEIGTIPPANYYKFITLANFLKEGGADAILLACSTFNRAVEHAQGVVDIPMLQIDRPMMDIAVQTGKKIGLLATLPSTVPSSERLLKKAAHEAGKDIDINTVLSSDAFEALLNKDIEKHNEILLSEIDKLSGEVDVIVLAQVSMTALEPYLLKTAVPVLNSGRTGFSRIREILETI
jgi:aspartate/glutamate racemase